jgi:hypothetical protein
MTWMTRHGEQQAPYPERPGSGSVQERSNSTPEEGIRYGTTEKAQSTGLTAIGYRKGKRAISGGRPLAQLRQLKPVRSVGDAAHHLEQSRNRALGRTAVERQPAGVDE